jgi:hypothetical protein
MISLVVSTKQGELIEAGMIGCEGAAGLQSALGPRAVVQIAGTFCVVSAESLRRTVAASEEAKALVQQYIETLWVEAQQIAACNAAHEATTRMARWLRLLRIPFGRESQLPDRAASIADLEVEQDFANTMRCHLADYVLYISLDAGRYRRKVAPRDGAGVKNLRPG